MIIYGVRLRAVPFNLDVKVDGIEDVLKRLEMLGSKPAGRVIRKGIAEGAKIVRKEAKARAKRIDRKSTATNIGKNIAMRYNSKKFRKTREISYSVGIRTVSKRYRKNPRNIRLGRVGRTYAGGGARGNIAIAASDLKGGDTYYWKFFETGTPRIKKNEFFSKALKAKEQEVTFKVANAIRIGLFRLVTKK